MNEWNKELYKSIFSVMGCCALLVIISFVLSKFVSIWIFSGLMIMGIFLIFAFAYYAVLCFDHIIQEKRKETDSKKEKVMKC